MTTLSVDIQPALSALSEGQIAGASGLTSLAVPQPSAEAVQAFQTAMGSLVADNQALQAQLETVIARPLNISTPMAQPEVKAVITPAVVREFAEVIAPLVNENRSLQTALEQVVPLPLNVSMPTVQPVAVPEVKAVITPAVVREFAEVIAPLVNENRSLQTALEQVVPLPLNVSMPTVQPEVKPAVVAAAQPAIQPEVKAVTTPAVVREFAEVIAPLVNENRVLQTALEQAVPLPLEVATRPSRGVMAEDKAPAAELPDAGVVLQAAPIMQPQPIVAASRPEASAAAVAEVKAPTTAVPVAPTPSEVLIAAAEAVADTIMVTPGLLMGEGQIRVQLRPDVLEGTEIQLNVAGKTISVEFLPQTADMSVLIERCLPQLEQHLAAKIHSFKIATSVAEFRRRKV